MLPQSRPMFFFLEKSANARMSRRSVSERCKLSSDNLSFVPAISSLQTRLMPNLIFLLFFTLMISVIYGCASIRPPLTSRTEVRDMIVTGYCPCGLCCDWEKDWRFRPVTKSGPARGRPKKMGLTTSGVMARRGTVAADQKYPFGTIVYVEGYGYGRVEDRGSDIVGNRLDVFFPTHREAEEWGVRRMKVRIWIPSADAAPSGMATR